MLAQSSIVTRMTHELCREKQHVTPRHVPKAAKTPSPTHPTHHLRSNEGPMAILAQTKWNERRRSKNRTSRHGLPPQDTRRQRAPELATTARTSIRRSHRLRGRTRAQEELQ